MRGMATIGREAAGCSALGREVGGCSALGRAVARRMHQPTTFEVNTLENYYLRARIPARTITPMHGLGYHYRGLQR